MQKYIYTKSLVIITQLTPLIAKPQILQSDMRSRYHITVFTSSLISCRESRARPRVIVSSSRSPIALPLTLLLFENKTEILEIVRGHEVPIQVNGANWSARVFDRCARWTGPLGRHLQRAVVQHTFPSDSPSSPSPSGGNSHCWLPCSLWGISDNSRSDVCILLLSAETSQFTITPPASDYIARLWITVPSWSRGKLPRSGLICNLLDLRFLIPSWRPRSLTG